jgi:hypothetical protein
MNTTLKLVLAAAAAAASIGASAQPLHRVVLSDIDTRQARQEQRIEQGIARGDLTRFEARQLRQGQREIARAEARAKADGRVDRRELRQLTALLDQADVHIRQARHDRDQRRGA